MNTRSMSIAILAPETVIRSIRAEDAPALRSLYLDLLGGTFLNFPPEAIAAYTEDWTIPLLEQRALAARHLLLGGFSNDGRAEGLLFGAVPDGGVGTIIWLGVAEAWRNQGLGGTLLTQAFEGYRQRGCHKVKVYTETPAAKRFYERMGMTTEGFHPRHWYGVDFWSLGIQL